MGTLQAGSARPAIARLEACSINKTSKMHIDNRRHVTLFQANIPRVGAPTPQALKHWKSPFNFHCKPVTEAGLKNIQC